MRGGVDGGECVPEESGIDAADSETDLTLLLMLMKDIFGFYLFRRGGLEASFSEVAVGEERIEKCLVVIQVQVARHSI